MTDVADEERARTILDRLVDSYGKEPFLISAYPFFADNLAAVLREARAEGFRAGMPLRPLEDWHEDFGDVLWWAFPVKEPPYVGSPLDTEWPGYHTHWQIIKVPSPPQESQ